MFLELGVGTGRIALPLIARGYRYIALDADAAMLEVFRQKIAGVDRKVQVVQADARAIPSRTRASTGSSSSTSGTSSPTGPRSWPRPSGS